MKQTQEFGGNLGIPKESEHITSNQIRVVRLCYESSKRKPQFLGREVVQCKVHYVKFIMVGQTETCLEEQKRKKSMEGNNALDMREKEVVASEDRWSLSD